MSDDTTLNEFVNSEKGSKEKDGNSVNEVEESVREMFGIGQIPREWDIQPLADLAEIIAGNSPPSSTYNEDGNGLPFFQGNSEFGHFHPEADTWCSEPRKIAETDDILISIRAPVGDLNIANQRCCIGRGLTALRQNDTSGLYLYYHLAERKDWLSRLATGSTFKSITKGDLQNLDIPCPSLPEQRKVATILHTVDQAIQKTEEITEQSKQALEALKIELFTTGYSDSEIKESNEWRCRASQFPREWEVKPAEELMEITRGASPRPRSDDTLFGGDIPWIKIGDAERNETKRIESVDSYVTEKGKEKSKFVEENTLLVANSGATCGFSVFAGVDGCVHDGWLILREYEGFHPDFLYHYINWNYNYLQSLSLGSAQTNLSTSLFGRLDIPIPSIEEQKKIVDTLDSVGSAILQNKRELNPLHCLKRGLMQDLLSGEVRTTDVNIDIPEEVAKYG